MHSKHIFCCSFSDSHSKVFAAARSVHLHQNENKFNSPQTQERSQKVNEHKSVYQIAAKCSFFLREMSWLVSIGETLMEVGENNSLTPGPWLIWKTHLRGRETTLNHYLSFAPWSHRRLINEGSKKKPKKPISNKFCFIVMDFHFRLLEEKSSAHYQIRSH